MAPSLSLPSYETERGQAYQDERQGEQKKEGDHLSEEF